MQERSHLGCSADKVARASSDSPISLAHTLVNTPPTHTCSRARTCKASASHPLCFVEPPLPLCVCVCISLLLARCAWSSLRRALRISSWHESTSDSSPLSFHPPLDGSSKPSRPSVCSSHLLPTPFPSCSLYFSFSSPPLFPSSCRARAISPLSPNYVTEYNPLPPFPASCSTLLFRVFLSVGRVMKYRPIPSLPREFAPRSSFTRILGVEANPLFENCAAQWSTRHNRRNV